MLDASKLKIPTRQTPRIDAIFAILLLCATVTTAFCVYQATRWNGEQATDFGNSSRLRTESVRASMLANTEIIVDVDTFLAWVNAVSSGDEAAATFLESRFRPEFRPAFEKWKARGNTTNPVPPGTPFSLPEYKLSAQQQSLALEAAAAEAFQEATYDNENGDLYIANTVLFAIVLFFCGVYTKWESPNVRVGMLIVTTAIFGIAVFLMVSLLLKVGFL